MHRDAVRLDRLRAVGVPTRGFSLLELLIAVTLIAVMIALLIPRLSEARQVARQISCLSLQRGLFTATQLYADDNKQWYPLHGPYPDFWSSGNPHAVRSKAAINGYLNNRYPVCPDYNRSSTTTVTATYYVMVGVTSLSGVTDYSALGTPPGAMRRDLLPFRGPYYSETNIYLERRMPVVTDANWSASGTPAINPRRWQYSNHPDPRDAGISGANAIYADGSGRFTSYSSAGFQYWFQPLGGVSAWGYYGSVYYPLPRF